MWKLILVALCVGACSVDDNRPDHFAGSKSTGNTLEQFPMNEANCKNDARMIAAASRYFNYRQAFLDCMAGKGWVYKGKG